MMQSVLTIPKLFMTRPKARKPLRPLVRCTAETAECTCPDYCNRDHDRD